jgi:hypothetical protein
MPKDGTATWTRGLFNWHCPHTYAGMQASHVTKVNRVQRARKQKMAVPTVAITFRPGYLRGKG